MAKIVTKKEFKERLRPRLKAEGKQIALCHGVFDLIHPGHIVHFEQAKEMADVLVVSITAEKYVRKGPGRPYFNDELRMEFLAAIGCIDYVMLSEGYTVDDIVESVEPDFYVKGAEYADEDMDITANMRPERELVEAHGGTVRFTSGPVFSSTKLINTGLAGLSEETISYMRHFQRHFCLKDLITYAEQAKTSKILVVGETIVDRYTYCRIQGLINKDAVFSAHEVRKEDFFGGAGAIARHLASFSKDVTLLSVIGEEPEIEEVLQGSTKASTLQSILLTNSRQHTIIKQRYLIHNENRDEYRKIFAVDNIPENLSLDAKTRDLLLKKLRELVPQANAVFVCDFGHGLFDREIMDYIQDNAKFIALNCQTNSSNRGRNPITKYRRADVFSLDEQELLLAYPPLADDQANALLRLRDHLGAAGGWLTRGSRGAWSLGMGEDEVCSCPAFTLKVKDTIGAGDAFYAVASLFASVGAPIEASLVMGNIAGALGARIIGNKLPVERVDVLKFLDTLMKV